jgi:hypothetical protein
MMLSNMPLPLQQRRRGQVIFHLSHLLVFILFLQDHSDDVVKHASTSATTKKRASDLPLVTFAGIHSVFTGPLRWCCQTCLYLYNNEEEGKWSSTCHICWYSFCFYRVILTTSNP